MMLTQLKLDEESGTCQKKNTQPLSGDVPSKSTRFSIVAYLLAIKNLAIIHTSPLLARIPLHSSMIPDTRKIVHGFNSVMMYHIYVYRYNIYIYIIHTHTQLYVILTDMSHNLQNIIQSSTPPAFSMAIGGSRLVAAGRSLAGLGQRGGAGAAGWGQNCQASVLGKMEENWRKNGRRMDRSKVVEIGHGW